MQLGNSVISTCSPPVFVRYYSLLWKIGKKTNSANCQSHYGNRHRVHTMFLVYYKYRNSNNDKEVFIIMSSGTIKLSRVTVTIFLLKVESVSYTHLDVYKRQPPSIVKCSCNIQKDCCHIILT